MKIFEKSKIMEYQKNGCFFKIAWFVFLCLVSALLARYALAGISDMLAVGKSAGTVMVEIPEGSSLDAIAEILKNNNIINEKQFFKFYTRVTKSANNFSPGVYELETNMDYQAILNHLKNHSNIKNVAEITFTEGMNILECAELIEKNQVCKKDEFLKCCNSNQFDDKYSFIKNIDNQKDRVYKLEGYLFPDTYKFYQGEDASNVVIKLLNNFQKKVIKKDILEGYEGKVSIKELAEEKGFSIDKLMNIASLIQAEAANKEDMYKVSSVIHNRLNTLSNGGYSLFGEAAMGILRIDATVYYPYKNKASLPGNVSKNFTSNYNTYKIEGLPSGPLCNPGTDAILAALNPAKTDYYYYCHSKSGEAFYAKTNDAHIANLRKAGL